MLIKVFPTGKVLFGENEYRCALGRSGIVLAEDKYEGDGATPAGIWPIRRVWYRADRLSCPPTDIPTRVIEEDDGWCDDFKDPQYNRHIKLPYPASREKMWREDGVYDLVVELGYNDSPVHPKKGSAIFIHIARDQYPPTDGCVALSKPDFLEILEQLKPDSQVEVIAE